LSHKAVRFWGTRFLVLVFCSAIGLEKPLGMTRLMRTPGECDGPGDSGVSVIVGAGPVPGGQAVHSEGYHTAGNHKGRPQWFPALVQMTLFCSQGAKLRYAADPHRQTHRKPARSLRPRRYVVVCRLEMDGGLQWRRLISLRSVLPVLVGPADRQAKRAGSSRPLCGGFKARCY